MINPFSKAYFTALILEYLRHEWRVETYRADKKMLSSHRINVMEYSPQEENLVVFPLPSNPVNEGKATTISIMHKKFLVWEGYPSNLDDLNAVEGSSFSITKVIAPVSELRNPSW